MTNSKTVEYKNVERNIQWLPGRSLFYKLKIMDLLFFIKGISSFEKVFK